MRIANVESRPGSPVKPNGDPAVVEEMLFLDAEGETVVKFTKNGAGLVALELGGVVVASNADYTPETLTSALASDVDMFDGVLQVETATVGGSCSEAGNLIVTITSAIVAGSPLDVTVPLTTAENTSAKVATEIRAALNATAAVTTHFTVGGSTTAVVLTAKAKAANDATLNIDINADHASTTAVGVDNVATSANTTAGVAVSVADTMTDLALSATLEAGATYDITFKAPVESAVKGARFDFDGGTATATNFVGDWVWTESAAPATPLGARVSALATDFGPAGTDAKDGTYLFRGTIEVDSGGTFIPRASQNAADVGITTVMRGATLKAVKV